jgi:hypothetical protein
MATSKTARIEAEIVKVKSKISEYQAKLRELEGKKIAIENTEIVDIVRGLSIPLDELAALLQSRNGKIVLPSPTSGQLGQKSKTAETANNEESEDDAI